MRHLFTDDGDEDEPNPDIDANDSGNPEIGDGALDVEGQIL